MSQTVANLSIRVRQILMILTVLLLFSMVAQQPSSPAADDSGVIQGTVVAPDGKPVAGATVYAIAMSEEDRPLGGRWPPFSTESNYNGDFVLTHVTPDKKVKVYAYKYSDYYEDPAEPLILNFPQNWDPTAVEVQPRQTVTGVIVRLPPKVGRIHVAVYDAGTKNLVHGIFMKLCRDDDPIRCMSGSGPSDYERLISLGVQLSIEIEADDGQHQKWYYSNPKTGSRYFEAKSGETETMDVYLRKKK